LSEVATTGTEHLIENRPLHWAPRKSMRAATSVLRCEMARGAHRKSPENEDVYKGDKRVLHNGCEARHLTITTSWVLSLWPLQIKAL